MFIERWLGKSLIVPSGTKWERLPSGFNPLAGCWNLHPVPTGRQVILGILCYKHPVPNGTKAMQLTLAKTPTFARVRSAFRFGGTPILWEIKHSPQMIEPPRMWGGILNFFIEIYHGQGWGPPWMWTPPLDFGDE